MNHLRPDLGPYRRWVTGSTVMSGLPLRVRDGKKAPGDLVLEWLTPDGWVAIDFHTIGFLVDFLYENEHHLYPPRDGYMGGEKLIEHMNRSIQRGWKAGADYLNGEKRTAADRRGAA